MFREIEKGIRLGLRWPDGGHQLPERGAVQDRGEEVARARVREKEARVSE